MHTIFDKNYACLIEISPKCLGVLYDGYLDLLTNGKDGCYSIAIWTAGMATGPPLPIVPGDDTARRPIRCAAVEGETSYKSSG